MLILSRKPKESVMIGNDIEVVVLEVRGEQVRLGIRAPKEISVYRKEIYENIQKENVEASKSEVKTLKDLKKIVGGGKSIGS